MDNKKPSKPGRPKKRVGEYQRITLEVAKDVLVYVDSKSSSRRDYIEQVLRRDMEQDR